MSETASKPDPRRVMMAIAASVAGVMLAGKLTAYFVTGSAALLSDAAESVVHGAATGLAIFSLWYAAQPADPDHPYGHGRITYFSAGFEGAVVCFTALFVLWTGVHGLLFGVSPHDLPLGLTIAGVLAAINLCLGLALIRVGQRHQALVLVANGRHVLTDMWTSLAAIVGVGLTALTGITWLDPAAALLIGVYILISGFLLVRQSFRALMDEIDPHLIETLAVVLEGERAAGRLRGFHQLRCRLVEQTIWAEVHLLLPGNQPLRAAHARATQLEALLEKHVPDHKLHVTSHLEPAEDASAHEPVHEQGPLDQPGAPKPKP